jgi:hypothetical protein
MVPEINDRSTTDCSQRQTCGEDDGRFRVKRQLPKKLFARIQPITDCPEKESNMLLEIMISVSLDLI